MRRLPAPVLTRKPSGARWNLWQRSQCAVTSSNACLVSGVECPGCTFLITLTYFSGDGWENCHCNLFSRARVKCTGFGTCEGENKCILSSGISFMLQRSKGLLFFRTRFTNLFLTVHVVIELDTIPSRPKSAGTFGLTTSILTGMVLTCLEVASRRKIVPRDSYTVSAKQKEFMELSNFSCWRPMCLSKRDS